MTAPETVYPGARKPTGARPAQAPIAAWASSISAAMTARGRRTRS